MILSEHDKLGVEKLKDGIEKRGGTLAGIDRSQLIAVSMDEDCETAVDNARHLVTKYIGQPLHIRNACEIEPEYAKEIVNTLGSWPASEVDVERTSQLVDDEIVTRIVTSRTPRDVIEASANTVMRAVRTGGLLAWKQC